MLIKKRPRWISQPAWRRLMSGRNRATYLRRQVIRFAKSPRLAIAYAALRQAVRTADWQLVRERVARLTELAVEVGDRSTIDHMVKALRRFGCYREAGRLWIAELGPISKAVPNEWRGEDLAESTVLVNLNHTHRQGLGTGYRCAQYLPQITSMARRTLVIVEPRLVETFRRSFPELEIFASLEATRGERIDFVALPEFLIAWLTDDKPQPGFHPLKADTRRTVDLRNQYLAAQRTEAHRPLIGISWYSSHFGKDLPELHDWREFIARVDATFVSLQYGDVAHDVAAFGRDRIIVDPSIDQLVDMDAFAAQIAALDGVITIVNTLADAAGALDVPTVVLRDDWFRRDLPVLTDRAPYYPSMRIAGKNRRDWGAVLDEAWLKLGELSQEKSFARRHAATAHTHRSEPAKQS